MRIWKNGCVECSGDVYLDYKNGSRWRCIKCHRYYVPSPLPLGAIVEERQTEKPKTKAAANRDRALKILEFAILEKVVINPAGMNYFIEGYNRFGHCPCDPGRPDCPCPEAPAEIAEKGKCKCQLFWRSYGDIAVTTAIAMIYKKEKLNKTLMRKERKTALIGTGGFSKRLEKVAGLSKALILVHVGDQ